MYWIYFTRKDIFKKDQFWDTDSNEIYPICSKFYIDFDKDDNGDNGFLLWQKIYKKKKKQRDIFLVLITKIS